MSYATVQSCTLAGISALPVTVEIHIGGGLPGMSIVGLPQSAVRESKDRVKAAILHAGLDYPKVKIVVNLAPADIPKQGGRFDLPIALGILIANGQLPPECLSNHVVVGELGLTGLIRAVSGVLPTSLALASSDKTLVIPAANESEARRCRTTQLMVCHDLHLLYVQLKSHRKRGSHPLKPVPNRLDEERLLLQQNKAQSQNQSTIPLALVAPQSDFSVLDSVLPVPDMADVQGQAQARRALEIASAGAHNLLLVGPPGTGKSMLASRLPGIQPPMSDSECMEAACVASISHTGFDDVHWAVRPFRAPHHTASGVALVGGGGKPMPGEISLAHTGVLFLDELTEFPRAVLDVLREPMETGRITISRAARQADFPARFQLIAAMNPCPCGYDGDPDYTCRCTPDQIQRYASRVSGPFLDRIDLFITVNRLARTELAKRSTQECSKTIRARVVAAREKQIDRQGMNNSQLQGSLLDEHCALSTAGETILNKASEKLYLSLRATHRVLRVARTIADLDEAGEIRTEHLVEAIGYRQRVVRG